MDERAAPLAGPYATWVEPSSAARDMQLGEAIAWRAVGFAGWETAASHGGEWGRV